jgi:hypothetical protein
MLPSHKTLAIVLARAALAGVIAAAVLADDRIFLRI